MHGILNQHGSLNQDFDIIIRRNTTKQLKALKCMLRLFMQTRKHILTNTIASQGNIIVWNIKYQDSVYLKSIENHAHKIIRRMTSQLHQTSRT